MKERSKAWVCGRSLAGTAGSNSTGYIVVCLLVSAVCCQIEVSATTRSLIQGSPSECGASVIQEPPRGSLAHKGLQSREKKIKVIHG